ncbi:MAG: type VI secretion system contractile sheath large subunit [Rhodospirillaceae bacterium]|nr:type VI secretion system contractile sheath large subunit [Rhodospirillaceae bacterium]
MLPSISFGIEDIAQGRQRRVVAAEPLRILLIGDFSGAESCGEPAGIGRPIGFDRDTYEDCLARLAPRLRLDLPGGTLELQFKEMDDFHPDRLFHQAGVFERLRGLRRRLTNPSLFAAAAAEIAGWGGQGGAPAAGDGDAAHPAPDDPGDDAGLLDAALAATPQQVPSASTDRADALVDALVRSVVAPHVVPRPDPRQDELVGVVDAAIADGLRAILHHPAFQRLEATWRGLEFLVRRLETGAQLKLYLLDTGRASLAADLLDATDLQKTAFFKQVVEPSIGLEGGEHWGLMVGLFGFDHTAGDAALLGRLGRLTAQAGAAFVATARPTLFGAADLAATPDPDDWADQGDAADAEAWAVVRRMPEAVTICLAAPRLLLRQPYGRSSDPCEALAFEEVEGVPAHGHFLWGEAGLAAAFAIGSGFALSGWGLRISATAEIENLPFFVAATGDGDREPVPCAEVLLTERAAARMRMAGVTPVLSVRNQDMVRMPGLQSIAEVTAPLAGGWSTDE